MTRQLTAAEIMAVVGRRYDVPAGMLRAATRQRKISDARAVAAMLVWECCGWPYARIGRALGGKRHTSVMEMLQRVQRASADQPEFARALDEIRAELRSMAEAPAAPLPARQAFVMHGGAA